MSRLEPEGAHQYWPPFRTAELPRSAEAKLPPIAAARDQIHVHAREWACHPDRFCTPDESKSNQCKPVLKHTVEVASHPARQFAHSPLALPPARRGPGLNAAPSAGRRRRHAFRSSVSGLGSCRPGLRGRQPATQRASPAARYWSGFESAHIRPCFTAFCRRCSNQIQMKHRPWNP